MARAVFDHRPGPGHREPREVGLLSAQLSGLTDPKARTLACMPCAAKD